MWCGQRHDVAFGKIQISHLSASAVVLLLASKDLPARTSPHNLKVCKIILGDESKRLYSCAPLDRCGIDLMI